MFYLLIILLGLFKIGLKKDGIDKFIYLLYLTISYFIGTYLGTRKAE
jgi:hypothetical protein